MSVDKFGEIIRQKRDLFTTPNIYDYVGGDRVAVHNEKFRTNKQDRELVLFFYFDQKYYFPIWFEFRSINNNLLFLFREYKVDSFGLLRRILNSSLEKEEFYTAKIQALVYHTHNKPNHCLLLEGFQIDELDKIDVFESV